jgi:predicted GNAT family N-acyltransferase
LRDIELKTITHNSPEYEAAVALRSSILRQPLGLEFSDGELSAESDSHHVGCFVEGQLVGCLVLSPVDATQIQMRQVAVSGELEGKGIGRMMVKYSEELARQLGFHKIVLHARETAVPFYERLGYARIGDRFTEITIPHWAMEKRLPAAARPTTNDGSAGNAGRA